MARKPLRRLRTSAGHNGAPESAPVKPLLLLTLLYAPDANAWGLQTHVFLAQYALAMLPLADPDWRAAAARFPRLVLAGACLPDLAVVGRFLLHTPVFLRSHRWATLRRMVAVPRSEEHRALLVGYATHLVSDVVAHNDFVPEHEARIGRGAMIAHLVSEWAMDRYLPVEVAAGEVLGEAHVEAVAFVAAGFRCSDSLARRALNVLGRGERMLRATPAPALCAAAVRVMVRNWEGRFQAYLRRTTGGLAAVEMALAGGFEDFCGSDPEGGESDAGTDGGAGDHITRIVQAEHDARSRRQQRERHQDRDEPRVVRARDQRERHRMKRVT